MQNNKQRTEQIPKNQSANSKLHSTKPAKEKKNPKLKNQDSTKVEIENLQDLINIATKEKEIELKYDLERNVKLVSFV